MSDPIRTLYQQLIVEHAKHPRHRGALTGATHAATADNPLCGDIVTLQLVVVGDRITGVGHDGHGCTLSIAAASVLADRVVGMRLADVRALIDAYDAMIAAEPGAPDRAEVLGELAAFAGVREFRSRRACATLPARALVRALAAPGGE
jgi:nitrogen fixation NifU-like protein